VSDTTLALDLTEKAELYATAGIPDYWVLDLTGRRLLVFRDPGPVAAGGAAYRTHLTLGPSESVTPLSAPNASVTVADLLPCLRSTATAGACSDWPPATPSGPPWSSRSPASSLRSPISSAAGRST